MNLLGLTALFATALLFGGMTFFTVIVPTTVLRLLPPDPAAAFVRGLLPAYHAWVLATAAAAAVALAPLSAPAAGMMAAVAGLAFWLRQVLMPRMMLLADQSRAGEASAKHAFARAHRLSVLANLLQMVAAAVVLAGFVV